MKQTEIEAARIDKKMAREVAAIEKSIDRLKGENRERERLKTILELAVRDTPLNMRQLHIYGAYFQGARMAIMKIMEEHPPKDKCVAAELRLAVSSIINCDRWLNDRYEIKYRPEKLDKNGKAKSYEAYFYEQRTKEVEI